MSEGRPRAAPEPREIAGRYEIVKKLGAGAFGTVYQARDRTLGRMLAIKTIRLEGLAAASTDLDELLKRFKQEATAGAALKHPNIVTVYDFGQSEDLTYLAMEYVEGQGLERILHEAGRLPVARAAGLVAQAADALGYAHQHGVIHRDIKPANIMVEAGERVKVTDFGIARVTDSGENLTQTGGLLGTPSYMSPEQARGQKVDGRSDLFSLGCVLYELLTARKAFTGDTITAVLFKIITEEPTPLRKLAPHVPEEAAAIVARALRKDPEKRYQSGRELADDLLGLTRPGHVPTVRSVDVSTASDPGAPTIATPPTAQNTLASAPGVTRGAATVPPVPPTEVVPPPPPSAPPARTSTAARTRRPQPLPPRRPPGPRIGRAVGLAAAGLAALLVLALGTWWALGHREPTPPPVATATPTAEPPAAATPPETPQPTPSPEGPPPETAATPPPTVPQPTRTASAEGTGSGTTSPPPDTQTRATEPETAPSASETAPPAASQVGPPTTPAGGDFLDRLPEEPAPDGRAAGEAVARGFRSGGGSSTFGATGTYRRRPRIPRHTPAEKPAVYGLAWILSAQKAHLQRAGRYGTLDELVQAGDLPSVEQNASGDGFTRRQYRFTVRADGDRFRADARPLAPQGRAFYVDEAGYVLVND